MHAICLLDRRHLQYKQTFVQSIDEYLRMALSHPKKENIQKIPLYGFIFV